MHYNRFRHITNPKNENVEIGIVVFLQHNLKLVVFLQHNLKQGSAIEIR